MSTTVTMRARARKLAAPCGAFRAHAAPRPGHALCRTLLACTLWLATPAVAQTVQHDLWVPDGEVRASLVVDHTLFIGGRFGLVGPPVGNAVPDRKSVV